MKDIIFWQSVPAREREKRYLSELAALHQSTVPPSELLLPVHRKLRWKKGLKFIVAFEAVFLVFAICMTVWFCILETRFYNDTARVFHLGGEKMRHNAAQTTDPEKKAKIDKSIREGEELDRKWHTLYVVMLAVICMMAFVLPLAHATLNWFIHMRPGLILLRRGIPVRAVVVRKKRWLLATHLEVGFTTERGESIRKKQILREKESSLFQSGSPVWMLYLPSRPKMACIYGLKSALAEVVR